MHFTSLVVDVAPAEGKEFAPPKTGRGGNAERNEKSVVTSGIQELRQLGRRPYVVGGRAGRAPRRGDRRSCRVDDDPARADRVRERPAQDGVEVPDRPRREPATPVATTAPEHLSVEGGEMGARHEAELRRPQFVVEVQPEHGPV